MANRTIKVELTADELNTLKLKIEHYWVMFHPLGYDTRLDKPAYYDKDRKLWVAKISRLESCD
jgi:hypothetical protein